MMLFLISHFKKERGTMMTDVTRDGNFTEQTDPNTWSTTSRNTINIRSVIWSLRAYEFCYIFASTSSDQICLASSAGLL